MDFLFLWDMLEKTLHSGPTLPSSIQDLGENLLPLGKEINLVTLHKLIKMMPRRMCDCIPTVTSPLTLIALHFSQRSCSPAPCVPWSAAAASSCRSMLSCTCRKSPQLKVTRLLFFFFFYIFADVYRTHCSVTQSLLSAHS